MKINLRDIYAMNFVFHQRGAFKSKTDLETQSHANLFLFSFSSSTKCEGTGGGRRRRIREKYHNLRRETEINFSPHLLLGVRIFQKQHEL